MNVHEEAALNIFRGEATKVNLVKDNTGRLTELVHSNKKGNSDQSCNDAVFLLGDDIGSSC